MGAPEAAKRRLWFRYSDGTGSVRQFDGAEPHMPTSEVRDAIDELEREIRDSLAPVDVSSGGLEAVRMLRARLSVDGETPTTEGS